MVRNKTRLTKADSAPDTELIKATVVAIKINHLQFPKKRENDTTVKANGKATPESFTKTSCISHILPTLNFG